MRTTPQGAALDASKAASSRVAGHSVRHCRHTCAGELLHANGGNLQLVQKRLGHAKITTTPIYADVFDPEWTRSFGKNPWMRPTVALGGDMGSARQCPEDDVAGNDAPPSLTGGPARRASIPPSPRLRRTSRRAGGAAGRGCGTGSKG